MGDKKLDKIDKHAIKHWRKTKKKRNQKNKLKRSNSGDINDLKRIVELYKIYGNDNLALVNPAENPGILQVRNRSAEKRKIHKQLGLAPPTQLSQSNFNAAISTIQQQAIMLNDPSAPIPFNSNSNYGYSKEQSGELRKDVLNQSSALAQAPFVESQSNTNLQF
jgi:hypothetical protein